MFQKKDYREYFNQLSAIEREMELRGRRIEALLPDASAKKLIRSLVRDERRHEKIVEEIKFLFFGKNGRARKK